MVEFSQFYARIPFLTRYWLTITVVLSLLARVRVIDSGKLPLWWDPVFNGHEIWRPLTAVFYVPPEHFYFLISNYVLYRYSAKLESREFAGRPEDYFMVLMFNWLCGVGFAYYFNFPLLMSTMVMSVVTVWCQYNKHQVISTRYYFGLYDVELKAQYLPWAMLVANVMYDHHFYYRWGGYGRYGETLTPQGTEEFAGIITGYLTYYLLAQYPLDYGVPSPLKAPNFVKEWFTGVRSSSSSSWRPGPEPRPSSRYSYSAYSEHPWGRGYTTGARRCAAEAAAGFHETRTYWE